MVVESNDLFPEGIRVQLSDLIHGLVKLTGCLDDCLRDEELGSRLKAAGVLGESMT